MKRRILGGTGMSVSEFALGAMMFGAMGNTDHDESVRMIHTALDAGHQLRRHRGRLLRGESEEIVGRALQGPPRRRRARDEVRDAHGPDANQRGGSPRWIKRAVEDSLRRLGTDYIDLYQMHRPDYATDIGETLAALSDLVRAGKVRAIGSSTFPAELIVEAQWAAERGGHHRFRTEQPRYSILTRTIEGSVLPTAQRYGMGVLTYGPLSQRLAVRAGGPDAAATARTARAAGVRPGRPGQPGQAGGRPAAHQARRRAGLPLTHLATAFVRSHPAVTSVLIGPRTPEQLDDLLAGADVELSEDVLDRIDEIVPPGTEINPADNYLAAHPALADKRCAAADRPGRCGPVSRGPGSSRPRPGRRPRRPRR